MNHIKELSHALILGLFTMLLCIVLADGILGIDVGIAGKIVFWTSIVLLPLYARKIVKWRYTIVNLPFYFTLYFIFVASHWGNLQYSFFKASGGFIAIPDWWSALAAALILWGLESIVYAIRNSVSLIQRRMNTPV